MVKGILFNTDMVRAILDGRKTVTRRVCKDDNDYVVPDMSFYDADRRTYAVHNYADKGHTEQLSIAERTCPICPGDILYVRETWRPTTGKMHTIDLSTKKIVSTTEHQGYEYKAHIVGNENPYYFPDGFKESKDWEHLSEITFSGKWRPSIHMPKEAARIWLKVTEVRVERLQDMKTEDFQKEGMTVGDIPDWWNIIEQKFRKLWNSTMPKSDLDKYGWEANPWVWVIEFERIVKPE